MPDVRGLAVSCASESRCIPCGRSRMSWPMTCDTMRANSPFHSRRRPPAHRKSRGSFCNLDRSPSRRTRSTTIISGWNTSSPKSGSIPDFSTPAINGPQRRQSHGMAAANLNHQTHIRSSPCHRKDVVTRAKAMQLRRDFARDHVVGACRRLVKGRSSTMRCCRTPCDPPKDHPGDRLFSG